MAAGVVTVAHDSGGPRLDIIGEEASAYTSSNASEISNTRSDVASTNNDEDEPVRNSSWKLSMDESRRLGKSAVARTLPLLLFNATT